MSTVKAPKEKKNAAESIQKAINNAIQARNIHVQKDDHVSISCGNGKLGHVANVSLPPVITCHNCKECSKYCYAIRNYLRMGYSTDNAWTKNYAIYLHDRKKYFAEINTACYCVRFFRWHVSGDIVNKEYLHEMVKIANNNKHCEFLAFTKNYQAVNEYITDSMDKIDEYPIPKNLHLLFSAAPNTEMNNEYQLPECHIAFEDSRKNTFKGCTGTVYHCTGNCEECIATGCGCFNLKNGDVTIINQH